MITNLINKFKNNDFINASLYSGLAAITKILSAIVIAKVVAVLLGPDGLAIIGQLNNFILLFVTLAGSAISQGLVKYVAQYVKEDLSRLNAIISTGLKLILVCSLSLALILILFSTYFSSFILLDTKYSYVFYILGITLVFSGINALFTSVLNGFKEFKKFNIITIVGNLVGLLISVLFMYFYNITGVLLSLVLNQAILFGVTYYYIKNEPWFYFKNYLAIPFNRDLAKDLSKYAALSLFSTVLVPIVTVLIRKSIIDEVSLTAAGYYEFILRLSSVTIMFFSIVISTYYIPRISEITKVSSLKSEVKSTYKIVIPVVLLILGVIYISRTLIVKILATDDFLLTTEVYGWQAIADFFRICAQVISFILVAKAFIKEAIIIEVCYNLVNLGLCLFMIPIYGFEGAIYVSCFMNLLYFVFFTILYKYYIIPKLENRTSNIEKYDS